MFGRVGIDALHLQQFCRAVQRVRQTFIGLIERGGHHHRLLLLECAGGGETVGVELRGQGAVLAGQLLFVHVKLRCQLEKLESAGHDNSLICMHSYCIFRVQSAFFMLQKQPALPKCVLQNYTARPMQAAFDL